MWQLERQHGGAARHGGAQPEQACSRGAAGGEQSGRAWREARGTGERGTRRAAKVQRLSGLAGHDSGSTETRGTGGRAGREARGMGERGGTPGGAARACVVGRERQGQDGGVWWEGPEGRRCAGRDWWNALCRWIKNRVVKNYLGDVDVPYAREIAINDV